MFNKNDSLVASVRKVMEQNARERQAAQAVNEMFGITDRRALPHERYAEWDAAYKAVLSEELKGDQHKIDANKNGRVDGHDFKILRAVKNRVKQKMEEESMMPDAFAKVKLKGGKTTTNNTAGDSTSGLVNSIKREKPAPVAQDLTKPKPSIAAREPDAKTGSTGGRAGIFGMAQARRDNMADAMNARIAKSKRDAAIAKDPKAKPPTNFPAKTDGPIGKAINAAGRVAPKMGSSAQAATSSGAKPVAQSNPSSFKFTDDERKGKVSAERLKQWKASQGAGGDKLSLGNFMNAAKNKTAVAGGKNDTSGQQKTYNIKRSNLDRGQ